MTGILHFVKEILAALGRLLGDASARSTMVAGILIYSVLYPQPYVGEVVRDVPVAVIDQDNSTSSRSFLRQVDATDKAQIVATASGMDEAQDLFFRRDVYGIILIPAGFEQHLLAGQPSPVAAYADGSYLLVYSNVMTAVTTVARTMGAEVNFARLTAQGLDQGLAETILAPVTVTSVPVFNPQGGYASYVIPAAFVLILQQTLLMGIGLLHAGQRLPRGSQIWATSVAYIGLYLIWIAFTQVLLPLLYGIPRTGDLGTLLLVALPFLAACTAMGFALSVVIPWKEGVVFFLVVMGMPLFFLSGISWPIEAIRDGLRLLSLLVPSSTAISAFVAVDQMGAAPQDIAEAVQIQIALAALYTAIALAVSGRRERDRKGASAGEGGRSGTA